MGVHVVEQGECLSSIAARYGGLSWQDLHDHPDNAELKKSRPNPNVLAPGDEVTLPDPGPAKWVGATVERRHRFLVKLPKVKLRVRIVDRTGKALGGKRFSLSVGARDVDGTTTSDGLVEAEVRATESSARLRVWLHDDGPDALPTIDRQLSIGDIDPIDSTSGVQGRLHNLGYRCPLSNEIADDLDDPTLVAVRSFRAKNGLPDVARPTADADAPQDPAEPTSEQIAAYVAQLIDDAFRQKLGAAYEATGGGA
jgi:hypothetical protein